MAKGYTGESIKIMDGLEAVRKRPGMYIGSTDYRGLHHLVYEIVDNSIDEALAGFGNEIEVTIHLDNSVTVKDMGRGVPIDMHESGQSTPEVIFTILHAGGKFGSDSYKTSGGLHGVGSSVVNALSSKMCVTISRDGGLYEIVFERGKTVEPLKRIGSSRTTGTTLRFWPDETVFSTTEFKDDILLERLRESTFLIPGLQIRYYNERTKKEQHFEYPEGLKNFIEYLNEDKTSISEIFQSTGVSKEIQVDIALQYTTAYSENLHSFVNNVKTGDGGTHESAAKAALTKVVNEYARKNEYLKQKEPNFEGTDIREGLVLVLSLLIPEHLLQFESQTKSKLGTPDARVAVDTVLTEKLMFFFEENPQLAKKIIEKIKKSQAARLAARKARQETRQGKNKKEKILSGKLTPASSKKYEENELYIVEGDSAGGSAKQGRDRIHQAILPLRGKIINSEKSSLSDVLKNEEIMTIINTIGAGISEDFDIKNSKYGKIIIMTDADTDGAHIQVLLLTFFYRFMRELVEAGSIYIALPPLYKISKKVAKKEEIMYAWTDDEMRKATQHFKTGYYVQRYKGLGEMNADQLWETTMNPETRTLIRVSLEDAILAEKSVTTLMGDNVEIRRHWIEEHIDFTIQDTYDIKEV